MTGVPHEVAQIDWDRWHPAERAVLCFVLDGEHVLLIHKKTGLGQGKINGPGGRIENGELPAQAAIRETAEETGITPHEPREAAILSFAFTDGYSMLCTAFVSSGWHGLLTETVEAAPFWCPRESIPYERMWEDDALWLPQALRGEHVIGRFVFEGDRMISHRVSAERRPGRP